MKLKLLIPTVLIPFCLFAQVPYEFDNIQVNNLKIVLNSDGEIHNNEDTFDHSEMPKGSGLRTVYNQHLWLGGTDELGTLRLAANTYKQSGQDFWPGPVATNYQGSYDADYNKVWHLKKVDIENHRANYTTSGYTVPADIANWPANGNTSVGIAQNLAPYSDMNNNDIYEPALGDFPLIRGDEALFVIYNDSRSVHSESGANKIEVEIHHMLYAFNDPENPYNDNSYYSHYEIFNRGNHSFSNFWVSNWIDFDLGHLLDDYIQTDVQRNLVFAFNGDSLDEDELGYGANAPVYGCVQLNESLEYSMSYNNSQNAVDGNPDVGSDFMNYMRARFRNGNQILNLDSNVVNHIYPGNSVNDSVIWSESSVGNIPDDRRMIGTSELFNFDPGTSICLDYASVFAHDTTLNPQAQIGYLQGLVDEVQDFYDNQYADCSDVSDLSVNDNFVFDGTEISLVKENGLYILQTNTEFTENIKIKIIDVLGRSHKILSLEIGNTAQVLPTKNLTKGIYFVSLIGNSTEKSFKVVIE